MRRGARPSEFAITQARCIVDAIAAGLGTSYTQLIQPDWNRGARRRELARPRMLAMYLVRAMEGLSLPQIGHVFRRDHTTVLHGCRKIWSLFADQGESEQLFALVELAEALEPPLSDIGARIREAA